MKTSKLVAGLSVALLAAAFYVAPAQASCRDDNSCFFLKKHTMKSAHLQKAKHGKKVRVASARKLSSGKLRSAEAMAVVVPRGRGNVVAMIKAAAPRYGVPTWFALRIAKVESGFNPRARGSAGEIGVFQLKCATARGIGYRGSCAGLYNASTNIQFGLKHLSMAVRSSHGNLKLAASKHNGGLGRKRLVPGYVSRVF